MDNKPPRLAAIDALPNEMQDHALVDWPTVAVIIGSKDVANTREMISRVVPLVHVSERRRLPRWGALKEFLRSRELSGGKQDAA